MYSCEYSPQDSTKILPSYKGSLPNQHEESECGRRCEAQAGFEGFSSIKPHRRTFLCPVSESYTRQYRLHGFFRRMNIHWIHMAWIVKMQTKRFDELQTRLQSFYVSVPIYFVSLVSSAMNRTCPCWKWEACPPRVSFVCFVCAPCCWCWCSSSSTEFTRVRGPALEASTEGRMASWGNFGIMISQLRGDDYPIKAVTIGQLAEVRLKLLYWASLVEPVLNWQILSQLAESSFCCSNL